MTWVIWGYPHFRKPPRVTCGFRSYVELSSIIKARCLSQSWPQLRGIISCLLVWLHPRSFGEPESSTHAMCRDGRQTPVLTSTNVHWSKSACLFIHPQVKVHTSTIINPHQPSSTIIDHHQPSSFPMAAWNLRSRFFFSGRGHDELLLDGNRAQNLRGNSGVGSILGRLKPPKKHGNHSHNHHNPIFGRLNLYYNHNHNNNPIMIIFVFICGRLIQIQS